VIAITRQRYKVLGVVGWWGGGSTDFDETSPSERCIYEDADSDFLAGRFNGFTTIQRI